MLTTHDHLLRLANAFAHNPNVEGKSYKKDINLLKDKLIPQILKENDPLSNEVSVATRLKKQIDFDQRDSHNILILVAQLESMYRNR